ncbi:hypothetical protein [Stenotrophomonas rhizophila]
MARTCESSLHRKQLLASDVAACYYCFAEFPLGASAAWRDGEQQDQTALCPQCGVDAVVGFTGAVDVAWLRHAHEQGFA